jgi:hypothetical protein
MSLESSSTQAYTSCKREALLPSGTDIIGTAYTSSSSCTYSSDTSVFQGAAISCEELEGTVVRSPVLAAEGATSGKCGGVFGCAGDWRTIWAIDVGLVPPKHKLLSSGIVIGEAEAAQTADNFTCIPIGHLYERPEAKVENGQENSWIFQYRFPYFSDHFHII